MTMPSYILRVARSGRYLNLARQLFGDPEHLETRWTSDPAEAFQFQSAKAARNMAARLYIDYEIFKVRE